MNSARKTNRWVGRIFGMTAIFCLAYSGVKLLLVIASAAAFAAIEGMTEPHDE